ncbi:MAG: hypothetical protein ACXVJK_08110 [Candidatus Aminicenantales bacterium]
MEGHELLEKMNRVKAPADFEERVFLKIGQARRARVRRRAVFRYAFAGSAAVFLIGFVLINGPFKDERAVLSSSQPASARAARTYLPVMETADYSKEFRNASYQPQTVYILEQVSEVRPSEIKY